MFNRRIEHTLKHTETTVLFCNLSTSSLTSTRNDYEKNIHKIRKVIPGTNQRIRTNSCLWDTQNQNKIMLFSQTKVVY